VGAILRADRIPLAECLREAGLKALDVALEGGEDYHLLFTVSGDRRKAFLDQAQAGGLTVHEIGSIVPSSEGVMLEDAGVRRALQPGFQHF
jgi:thiamine monophosphate kinase